MRRSLLGAAAVLVVLANAIAAGLAAYNRSGPAVATAVLTERELALPPADPENTGLWLEFRWQGPATDFPPEESARVAARERAALEALGFDCSMPPDGPAARRHYLWLMPRHGFVVFEFDGESWRAFADAVARGAEDPERARREGATSSLPTDAADRFRRERLGGSRLIPVDAGPDAALLRQRYPDGRRHLIVPGVVRLALVEPTATAPGRVGLRVAQAWPSVVHVPKDRRSPLDTLARTPRGQNDRWTTPSRPPRYEVAVQYGRRNEPWVSAVRLLPAPVE